MKNNNWATTRPNYLSALKKFCEFTGKTPKELILERDKEIKNLDPNTRTGVRDLKRYLEWRRQIGENLTVDSPLFASRTKRGTKHLRTKY